MTTKSNKELAVEITIAMINIINKIYNTLKELDKNQTSIATEEEQN